MKTNIVFLIFINILFTSGLLFGQVGGVNSNQLLGQGIDDRLNTITTAVPFLIISPDSRAGGMGEAGVSSSPDANSIHWNPAKLAFIESESSINTSYNPWLRNLVPDISLSYLAMNKRINNRSAIGGSLRYFSLGNITFTDEFGNTTQNFIPNEFALDLAYATKLSDHWSGGVAVRYVFSNLTGGAVVQNVVTEPGQSIVADVSAYYQNKDIRMGDKSGEFAFGVNISNIGAKMSYSNTTKQDFIPINLRLGPRITVDLDKYNSLSFMVDFNKLLVPTPPIYKLDSMGQGIPQGDGFAIGSGRDPNRAVANGMFGSFIDAPGNPLRDGNGDFIENPDGTYAVERGSVFREEMREFNMAFGIEYWYDKQFAVRTGYFWEHELKGNRKFATLGIGLRYSFLTFDFAYLIPIYFDASIVQNSPLQNTLRVSLGLDIDALRKTQKTEEL